MMQARARHGVLIALGTVAALSGPVRDAASQQPASQPSQAQTPPPATGVVIRGCLNGEKLSRIEPQNAEPAVELKLPDVLRVTTIKAIRSQVKALNGHQVEVRGALRGIPGIETGFVVADSDKGKLYIGGNQDPSVSRKEPPTIHADLIKDIAGTCPAASTSK